MRFEIGIAATTISERMGARKRHGGHQNAKQESKKRRRRRRLRKPGAEEIHMNSEFSGSEFDFSDTEGLSADESSDSKRSHPSRTPKSSGLSPMWAASVLVALIMATGGVYVYNFVDMTEALDTLQNRVTKIIYPNTAPVSSPSPPSTVLPNTESPKSQKASESAKPDREKGKGKKKQYHKLSITNSYDNKIRSQLDEADALFEKGQFEDSLSSYDTILSRYPSSPRARSGRAASLDEMSQKRQSNALLEQSIAEFIKVLDLPDVPRELMIKTGQRCADRQSFRGWGGKAVQTMKKLISLYPDDKKLKNDLGVKYLLTGRPNEARKVFWDVLRGSPEDGFAMVHYGFILKTTDNDNVRSIEYLQRGIDSGQEGTRDGRFYFHLGDAYYRNGQPNKSEEVFEEAAKHGLFRSKWQRSLYNVDRLESHPWWTVEETGSARQFKELEKHWKTIREEGLAQMDSSGAFLNEDENLREAGDWKQFTLYSRGRQNAANCAKVPKTCALLNKIPEASSCSRGQIKFSVMHPGTHVWPHTGPTNCRIRAHLGLVVPKGPRIRVTDDTRTWKEGKFIIFDDSFEHEVWHDGDSLRLVLIVDIWHPQITESEKKSLSPI